MAQGRGPGAPGGGGGGNPPRGGGQPQRNLVNEVSFIEQKVGITPNANAPLRFRIAELEQKMSVPANTQASLEQRVDDLLDALPAYAERIQNPPTAVTPGTPPAGGNTPAGGGNQPPAGNTPAQQAPAPTPPAQPKGFWEMVGEGLQKNFGGKQ